ncbi:MAG: UDP-N-acetylmuramoyl-tripeptide--D-alanyl-D-alanine ligase [Clostridia bacterium]|jgi:UDP-N-acetylmuramoyl-tripeptide--D-alanyl-D-alanine ligase|nr:UDP-N-acetylmuramoyl-tripeptide--D-alanyl-D-alanine ligase [Clostridia bacterium]
MKPILVSTVKEIVKGTLVTGLEDRLILGARRYLSSIKKPNMLTFVWENENPDWHRIKKYSPCTIVTSQFLEKYKSINNCSVILVNNVDEAYWTFVRYYRNSFNIPVITITGTSGKTTTKEMLKHILSRYLKITATVRNLNNSRRSLGNLLRIDDSIQAAVFETAVGKPGDVAYACKHLKPTMGIITNIGTYHLDTCRTVENYIKAKAEMVSGLNDNGILILNSDDEKTKKINLKDFKGRIVYFGVKNKADFQASNIKYSNNRMEFLLTFQNVNYAVSVQGYGDYQVYNTLAAMAVVHELGIELKEAAKILTSYENLPHHLEILNGINGSKIIDDTWNYNLSGLTAALKALDSIAPGKKKIAMLGGLGKLGEHSTEIINGVGNLIADVGIDNLIIIGDTAEAVANVVKERGGHTKINIFKDSLGLYDLLKELLDENTVTLVKCYRNEYSKPLLESLERIIVK